MRCLLTVQHANGTRLKRTEPEGETAVTSRAGACRLLLDELALVVQSAFFDLCQVGVNGYPYL